MKVILLQTNPKLGKLGDTITVKEGHARNFLIPKGKAIRANAKNIELFEQKKAELEAKQAEQLAKSHQRAKAFEGVAITIKANASEDGKLFGSVAVRDIVGALSESGHVVEKSEVVLPNGALRKVGDYEVTLQLEGGIEVVIKLSILPANLRARDVEEKVVDETASVEAA